MSSMLELYCEVIWLMLKSEISWSDLIMTHSQQIDNDSKSTYAGVALLL